MTSGPDRQGPAAGEALVLCYHAVSSDWDAELAVTPARLEAELELLLGRGYRGVTFSDAAGGRGGDRALAVTFDDGYRSVLDSARPILARLGIPGTVFVVTDLVGGGPMSWPGIDRWIGSAHERELVPMSWPELRYLADEGWEIGSHTRTHPRLTSLDDESLDDELGTSRSACSEKVGVECNALAYPYGADDERVAEAARGAGYGAAASLPSRLTGSTLRWPRIGIYRRDTLPRFRLKVSPAMRHLRSGAAWEILERARRGPSGSRPGGGAS